MGRILLIWLIVMFHVKFSFADGEWRDDVGNKGNVDCKVFEKKCIDREEKIVDGIKVNRPCWKYEYKKICDFPSKNNCREFENCYEIGIKKCLVWDGFGNCVNQLKEYSCKERTVNYKKKDVIKREIRGREAAEIVCKGIPCIDGNCIDKSYKMDEDILDSASKLHALKKIGEEKADLFRGSHEYCRKKPTGYMNCCKVEGWGEVLGAGCIKDEVELQKKRKRNLCVYVGKSTSGTRPFHVNKHHFCCFGNIFNKVFQKEARKQLDIDFGDGYGPDCGGMTLDEISSLDFNKMDFSEFHAEIVKNMKRPDIGDLQSRIENSMGKIDKENGVKE